ncbi:MAG: tetratricopeptide repeat protein [Bryobacter sp.]|nr:tetratricopeptide repeat protein [Bryobacter sp.]
MKFCFTLFFAASLVGAQTIEELRNLGKAFYENPTTQKEAAETWKRAWDRQPNSVRDQLNYGLALLRAGRNAEAVEQLLAVQKKAPEIPHTWFTLGIEFKKQGEPAKALEQMRGAVRLDPREPIIRYNLGVLEKQVGNPAASIRELEAARDLDPNLAAARFQLFNAYRQARRAADAQRELAEFQRLKKLTEGAAVPEDVDWSKYSEIYDPLPPRPPKDQTQPQFAERRLTWPIVGAMAYGNRLLTWDASGLRLDGVRTALLKGVAHVALGDFNNDGAVDLCAVHATGVQLMARKGNVWTRVAAKLPQEKFSRCVWLDFDHDYDLDLFLLGEKSYLFRNQGAQGFQDHSAAFPFVAGKAVDAVAFRAVADTRGFDLLVTYQGRASVLYRDLLLGKYQPEDYPAVPAGARNLLVGDFDANGQLDVAHGEAPRVFADLLNSGQAELVVAHAALDRDGDGRTDLIVEKQGAWVEQRNTTVTSNRAVRLQLTGVKNLVSAAQAEVEVRIGGLYQKFPYTGFPLLVGVGKAKEMDVVRITWPNGLIQNEMRQPVDKPLAYKEAQRLSGSCPIIWTWNGKEFEYVTDVLGVAPLGASAGDGTFFPTDKDEYITLRGEQLQPNAAGNLEVRLTEELSEAAYFDRIRLLAVDHPADTTIYSNEKWKGPPFSEFRLFGVTSPKRPLTAVDERGRNVRGKLLAKDQTYPDAFRRTSTAVAEMHSLELDFGAAAPGNDSVLVLEGWVDWADGSTFLAEAQAGPGLIPPYLEVQDEQGRWVKVIEDMGMPSGKPKAIAVDLKGKFLSRSRKVRITTNLCVYWDEIFLSEGSATPRHQLLALPLRAAQLRFRGFSPSLIHPERKQPERFSYPNPMPTSLWNPTPGLYTRYGDVLALLDQADDQLVVMGSGDETQLEFDASGLPPLPQGWRRDYLLHVEGWAKDRDANTAHSQTVSPLPFRSMSQYPYNRERETHPAPEYEKEFNTRPALRLIRPLVPQE